MNLDKTRLSSNKLVLNGLSITYSTDVRSKEKSGRVGEMVTNNRHKLITAWCRIIGGRLVEIGRWKTKRTYYGCVDENERRED